MVCFTSKAGVRFPQLARAVAAPACNIAFPRIVSHSLVINNHSKQHITHKHNYVLFAEYFNEYAGRRPTAIPLHHRLVGWVAVRRSAGTQKCFLPVSGGSPPACAYRQERLIARHVSMKTT